MEIDAQRARRNVTIVVAVLGALSLAWIAAVVLLSLVASLAFGRIG